MQSVDVADAEAVTGVVADVIRPRVEWVPEPASSLGAEAVAFARRVGMTLDPEQEFLLERTLGVREDGRWQTREVGINVPRQNGKGEVLIARELFGLFELGERKIIHTAHEFKTSQSHFARVEEVVRNSPELMGQVKRAPSGRVIGFRYGNGDEALELQSGAKLEFRTRTKSGMRGFEGVYLLVLDEAMIINEAGYSSALPIIRATKAERGPQVWLTGSAVDQETMEHALVWTRVRERGIAGGDQALAYFEWSVDVEHPDDLSDEQLLDVELWKQVNFALARGRIEVEHMEWERRAMSARGFAIELLGAGDYPETDVSADVLVSVDDWLGLEDPASVVLDPVCIAFDVSPDRNTAIVAAGRNEQGVLHVEVLAANSGTGWLTGRLKELYERHEVEEIVCDGYGPSAAMARKADEAGIKVRRLDSNEYGQACGLFADAVGEGTLRHIGQDELVAAIRGAKARPLVDRWAWSRTKSSVNIAPLVAATLALFSAVEKDVGEVAIF